MDAGNFKNNFKKRLLIVVSGGLFIACLCVAAISIWPLYNQMKAQQTEKLIFAVKSKKMLVEGFLAKARETALQITSRTGIRQWLEKYNNHEISITTLKKITVPKLQDAINLSNFAVGINRLDIRGNTVVQVGVPVPEKFLHPSGIAGNEVALKGPVTIGNTMLIVVSVPIINRQKNRVGTDIVLFTLANLRKIIRDYTGLGTTGEAILGRLNANGQPHLFFPMRPMTGSKLKLFRLQQLAIVGQALKNIYTDDNERTEYLLTAHNALAAYSPIAGTDWVIIVIMSKSELFSVITRQVLIIMLVIFVLVFPLGLTGLIFLLRPLSGRVLIHVDALQQEITAKENALQQQRVVEEKLLNEKERLNVTLRSIGDGVITTDLDGAIVLINKITEQLTGWSQQDAAGCQVQEIFNIINEKTGRPCDNPVREVLNTGKIVGLANHTVLIAKDGSQYNIEDSGAPIFNKESEIIGTVIVFRDVTEKMKNSKELLKVEKLESVGILAGGIAHDFNNMLVAILGNIELAGMSLKSTSVAYPLLQKAKKAALRSKDLTQQLLTFSKGGNPVKKTTSIGKVITESANFILHGTTVSCQLHIPDNLWLVEADSGQISQVVQNLVINAVHAMPDGGNIKIRAVNIVDTKAETHINLPAIDYIKIMVQDGGSGIPKKDLEKVFDPYFTTKQEGSGLGLAIVHSIISKHDGYIGVQSITGEGTTFSLYLPASPSREITQDGSGENSSAENPQSRIILMDDDELVQDVASEMLICLGHEVLLAKDGEEALAIFIEHHGTDQYIDAIIMDLTIPGAMGGKETIKEILKIDPAAKVIVSSGYSNHPVMANYWQYGFKAAIAKPFMLDDLAQVINSILA